MVKCHRCGRILAPQRVGPCPKCGSLDRDVFTHDVFTIAEAVSYAKTREFWERRTAPLAATIALTVGSPFLGLLVAGWPGVVVGLIVGVVAFAVGLVALTKVRDTERGGGA